MCIRDRHGTCRIDLDPHDLAGAMMPVPGRIGASAAADVEDAPEFAPDPVQEVRSIAGVVVGGFRDHHDGSLLADRRLPRWHRVLTQGPTVPRRSGPA